MQGYNTCMAVFSLDIIKYTQYWLESATLYLSNDSKMRRPLS